MNTIIKKIKSKDKKCILSLAIVLVGILSLLGGTSYAILKGSATSTKQQIIKTGKIELKLTENYESISKKMSVMSDVDGLSQDDVYEFTLKNIGDAAAKYELKLVNEVPSSYTGQVLDTKYIKIGLEINGEEYGPMSLEKVKNVIDSDILYKTEIMTYKLRVWLDSSKEEEIGNLEDYKVFLKLKVEAEQRPSSIDPGGSTKTFTYTGKVQEYTVPRDGYYYIEMAGGSGNAPTSNPDYAGASKTSGYIELKAGEKLYFYVGSKARQQKAASFNGGGGAGYGNAGYTISSSISGDTGTYGFTGGGATDVRLKGGSWDNTSSLISRIMVAGGGGSASNQAVYNNTGGNSESDGLSGMSGGYYSGHGDKSAYGTGASQTAGGTGGKNLDSYGTNNSGSFGKGGTSNSYSSNSGSSGGGGGYYGGGAGAGTGGGGSGHGSGGGSSYISGLAGVNSVANSATISHTNQTLHYSGKYFIGANVIGGNHYGDGYAKITFVDMKPKRRTQKLNNVRYIKDCVNNDSSNSVNSWTEIQAIKDGTNVAKGKTGNVYSSSGSAVASLGTNYAYSYATDGIIDNVGGSIGYATGTTRTGNQCFILDLEKTYDLDEVATWHYARDTRVYYDHITYVSSDNKAWTEVMNETRAEDYNGTRLNVYTPTYNGYIQDGLVLWLDGYSNTGTARNNTTTTWKDLSGTGNDLTVSGATWGYKSLYFDGTNDYASRSSAKYNISNNKYTLEILLKPEKQGNYQLIYDTINSGAAVKQYMSVWLGTSNKFNYDISNGSTSAQMSSTFTSVNNTMYALAASLDTKTYRLYNKAKLDATKELGFTPSMSNSGIYVGGSVYYYQGRIYSIRVYNKVLTQEEILHNYNYDKQKFNIE